MAMLLDVYKMAPAFGIPINRRQSICRNIPTAIALMEPVTNWQSLPLPNNALLVGSLITKIPMNLGKAIYRSTDGHWIFEVVFSQEQQKCLCLYVRILSPFGAGIAVSLDAIKFYHSHHRHLVPIWQYLDHQNSFFESTVGESYLEVENIVPAIVSLDQLSNILQEESRSGRTEFDRQQRRLMYKPLYDYVPGVFEALMVGEFTTPPFFDVTSYHPNYQITHDQWSYHQEFQHSAQVQEIEAYENHPAFDTIALSLMKLGLVKISVTTTFAFAIDQIEGLWITRTYQNPYAFMFSHTSLDRVDLNRELTTILHHAVVIYCRLHAVDANVYMKTCQEKSSITLSKNEYDEIMITFHDIINGRYVTYCTSFPAIALATLAVGSHHG